MTKDEIQVNSGIPRGVLNCFHKHVTEVIEEPYCHACTNEGLCDIMSFILNKAKPIADRRL